jgi:hypothetical protein
MARFIDMVAGIMPRPLSQRLSAAWFGLLGGYTGDALSDGMSIAARMALLRDPMSPDDVLPLIGNERRMPRYPGESAASYRERLHGAWVAYGEIGEPTIPEQFRIAGYPGVEIQFDAAATGPRGEAAPYWSQFWVYFPYSSAHPVTGDGPTWGAFNYGDGTVYGLGVPVSFYQLIHGIAGKWKPVRWFCRGFKFQLADLSIVEIAWGL